MKFNKILTNRNYQHWPSWHIIHEWEDEISSSMNIPLYEMPRKDNVLRKYVRKIDAKFFKDKLEKKFYKLWPLNKRKALYFEINTGKFKGFFNKLNTVPIIIDFWNKPQIEKTKIKYSDCPILLITSLEVLDFFKKNNFQNKLVHFPMTLPSIHELKVNDKLEKKYDIIIAGRKNPVLFKYLEKYENEHPDIEYIYQVDRGGQLYYESNKQGFIGNFHSREDYMNLIKMSKVGFYSTPGIDGGESRTHNFNPVTPRFFELLSGGCHVIARYPKNKETEYYNLDSISAFVDSFSSFKTTLTKFLNSPPPISNNAEYLKNHYTSNNLKILKNLECVKL